MIGLYCKEDDVINISSLPLVDNNIILSGKNSRFIIPILTILPYEQEICGFCLKNINDKNLYFLNNMIMLRGNSSVISSGSSTWTATGNFIQLSSTSADLSKNSLWNSTEASGLPLVGTIINTSLPSTWYLLIS